MKGKAVSEAMKAGILGEIHPYERCGDRQIPNQAGVEALFLAGPLAPQERAGDRTHCNHP
jgi:hypothetical protein